MSSSALPIQAASICDRSTFASANASSKARETGIVLSRKAWASGRAEGHGLRRPAAADEAAATA